MKTLISSFALAWSAHAALVAASASPALRGGMARNQTIIGGSTVTSALSWFVHLGSSGFCGGTLITADMVLTAAHCVDSSFPSTVRVGPITLTDGTTVSVDSSNSILHPGWTGTPGDPDVALLKLTSTVSNTPITLNSDCNTPCIGDSLQVYGFGMITNDGSGTTSSVLKTLTSSFQCLTSTNNLIDIFASSSSGACQGDSGGPAIIGNVQVGVASFVRGPSGCGSDGTCCAQGNPDAYARVSNFYSWIQTQVCARSSDTGSFSCGARGTVASAWRDGTAKVFFGAQEALYGMTNILGLTESYEKEDGWEWFPMGDRYN